MNIDGAIPVHATVMDEPVKQIQIPPGLRPGDSFIVTPENCIPFTVIVPEDANPGSYITVVVPTNAEVVSNSENSNEVKIDKGVAGAAFVGGVVGLLILGPVGGMLLAGGAAYAASKKDSKIGKEINKIGFKSYKGFGKAKNWTLEKLQKCT